MAEKLKPNITTWRDLIPVHPAAELFPMMSDEELDEFAADIAAYGGLRFPVTLWTPQKSWTPEQGVNDGSVTDEVFLLDGPNRLEALWRLHAGTPEWQIEVLQRELEVHGLPENAELLYGETDPLAYVVSANLHRRHLTAKQKQGIIATLLKNNPERSDRATAKIVSVSHHTVAAVRADAEARGQIAHVDKRTDTKGRQQPATKKATEPPSKPSPKATTPAAIKPASTETSRAAWIDGFSSQFQREPRATLCDIIAAISGYPAAVAKIPEVARRDIVRAFGAKLSINVLNVETMSSTEKAEDKSPTPGVSSDKVVH